MRKWVSVPYLYFGGCFPEVLFKSAAENAEAGETGELADFGYSILTGLQKFERMVHAYGFDKVGRGLV